jgi:WD repeat-containing protein 70
MGSETGHLHILNPATLRPELTTPVTSGSPLIAVLWHDKLNQIVTGSANGETHVLYNPTLSEKGAKMVMLKAPKRRHLDDDPNFTMDLTNGIDASSIIVPGSGQPPGTSFASRHPTIGLTQSGKSRDPRRPHLPFNGPFSKNAPTEEYVQKEFAGASMRDEDPREALLKYAEVAKNDPIFTRGVDQVTSAQYPQADEDEDERASKKAKR